MPDDKVDMTLVAFHPTQFRPLWKAAKTKHQAALTAKQVTFSEDLGKLLDQRTKQWTLMSATRPKTLKRVQLTPAEQAETNPAKRKATAKIIIANDASNAKLMTADFKQMVTLCNAIVKAARSYKTKVQGLGDPAEAELTEALDQVIAGAEGQLETTNNAQASLKTRFANPHRYDHLK